MSTHHTGGPVSLLLVRLLLQRPVRLQPRTRLPARLRDERGDIPGWVLITIMTAGLVTAVWAVAEPQLRDILSTALDSVRNP